MTQGEINWCFVVNLMSYIINAYVTDAAITSHHRHFVVRTQAVSIPKFSRSEWYCGDLCKGNIRVSLLNYYAPLAWHLHG